MFTQGSKLNQTVKSLSNLLEKNSLWLYISCFYYIISVTLKATGPSSLCTFQGASFEPNMLPHCHSLPLMPNQVVTGPSLS